MASSKDGQVSPLAAENESTPLPSNQDDQSGSQYPRRKSSED